MKKILSIILMVCFMLSIVPFGAFDLTVSALKSGKYTYTVISGKATINDCDDSISGNITLPSTLDGYPIISIGESAFCDCRNLTSVTIPNSVTSIGDYAFQDCTSLTSIVIPDGVTSIGTWAFYNTAYYNNTNNWVDDVLYIGDHLIKCQMSKSGTCTIKDSTKTIADSAFESCFRLTSIIVNKDNQYYSNDENGVLFNKDKTELLRCPPGTKIFSYTIPDSVASIGGSAFENCSGLVSITIPNNVTSIGPSAFRYCDGLINITIPNNVTSISDWTFYSCDNLRGITIPNSVISIGFFAFDQCPRLTTVFYRGTKSNKMDISIKMINSSLTDANWYYNHCIGSTPHAYTNNCDKDCSVCGTKRIITHTYSNNCDTKCNVCGVTRTITHSYVAATCTKAKTCKICGTKSGKALGHTYKNSCDTSCNVCKATRTITHAYKTTTTKATLSKNGSVVKKCTVCGKVESNTTIKYAKTFKLSTTTYTYNGKVKTLSVTVKDSAGKTLKKNTDYTVTYASGRKNVGTYKVTIKMKGKYSGTKTLTFKINPAKTTVSKLAAGKKSITVAITKKSTQVTGYQIQYSTSKKFTNAKTKTISSYKTTKYTLKSLSAKKTYYVRVRTYKTVGKTKYYSGWSTYKHIKTK